MIPKPTRSTIASIAVVFSLTLGAWAFFAFSPTSSARAAEAPGAALYAAKCAICHGAKGQGTISSIYSAPPLFKSDLVSASDPKAMIGIIVNGSRKPMVVNGQPYQGVMPAWKGQLSSADVALVATYIRSSWGNHASAVSVHQVAAAGTPVMMSVGASIYAARCSLCHGANGRGRTGIPSLVHNAHVTGADPDKVILTIENGGTNMPAWRGQLSDADVAAVATYIRSSWGNKAPPVTDGDVVSVMAK